MIMLKDLNSPISLDLSFNFEVTKYENRILDIKLEGLLREIKYSSKIFDWFMEDLILYLDKNQFQRRWDYGLIRIHNIDSLGFTLDEKKDFIKKFKTITSWEMEAV